jgi:SAM-dependent methyltransferase
MKQLELAARLVGYSNPARYELRGNFLFQGISLKGAVVLEVGCGTGAWAIWAALHGASNVVGIEPEAAGSSKSTLRLFRQNIDQLKLRDQIEAQSNCLQDLAESTGPFDVVVMYNVINHLDEEAVLVLDKDIVALERYTALLRKLWLHVHSASWLVVADCARNNFWSQLGLRSPLVPSIEWQKHQNPQIWIEVFRQAGFRNVDLRWSPMQVFPRFTGNRFVQYLTCSHFVLRFRPDERRPADVSSTACSEQWNSCSISRNSVDI